MNSFVPDVIVEATRACDRKCRGCYAPNVILGAGDTADLGTGLFLEESALYRALSALQTGHTRFRVLSIRGGEPSLHPKLGQLIATASLFADRVYVETHGRWLERIASRQALQQIVEACRSTRSTLKISFDSMHGLSGAKLETLVAAANAVGVDWVIAVTEDTVSAARNVLASVPWVPVDRTIFQPKAKRAEDLVRPNVATITTAGMIVGQITHKFSAAKASMEALA